MKEKLENLIQSQEIALKTLKLFEDSEKTIAIDQLALDTNIEALRIAKELRMCEY